MLSADFFEQQGHIDVEDRFCDEVEFLIFGRTVAFKATSMLRTVFATKPNS